MAAKHHDHLTEQLFEAILSLKDKEQCYNFFEDICTISELKALAQRLEVARMLDEGSIYEEIVIDYRIDCHCIGERHYLS